jgi:hypothetical protein
MKKAAVTRSSLQEQTISATLARSRSPRISGETASYPADERQPTNAAQDPRRELADLTEAAHLDDRAGLGMWQSQ